MDLARTTNSTPPSLKGKRIVLTALDLEQSEHRGIAVYSKTLIKTLNKAGAKVWLLTQFDAPLKNSNLKQLPKATQKIIHSSQVLNSLDTGKAIPNLLFLENQIPHLNKLGNIWRHLLEMIEYIKSPRTFNKRRIHKIELSNLYDNPNMRKERLGYLQDVEGILCADKIFNASQIAARFRRKRPVRIDLKGFDALITSCPLNIQPKNIDTFIQTIHDVIALEYAPHNENMFVFSKRLQACLASRRIFVSNSTATKFQENIMPHKADIINKSKSIDYKEKILIQPPSLLIPEWILQDKKNTCDLIPSTYLLNDNQSKERILSPFNYLLFNSSVEARKNLLFLVKAFQESNLSQKGVKLCVTGKLKKDSYSQEVQKIINQENNIITTGYIDETTKTDLYLNAIALLSPSLVEGFGIPALDSACLGMPAIISACESHNEIQSMDDFDKYLTTINTLETREWATAMKAIVGVHKEQMKHKQTERQRRIKRYSDKLQNINQNFIQGLVEIIN